MKTAIIYYSLSGNTEYVAETIKKEINADLIKITPKKEFPNKGFKKFFWGGKSAVMGETPALEKYTFDPEKYDNIIIGTPVWASTFTPPIRTFLKENKEQLKDKKISVFICYSGGGADKAIEKMKKYLNIDSFANELILIDPKDKNSEDKERKIIDFIKKII